MRDRDRDISDDEYSPTNVCMFPESWEDAMPSSVTTAPRDFEQFRSELMGIQKILDSPALVDLEEVDLNELGEPPREYISDEDFESHVEDDGIGPLVAKFSEMENRDLIPSKQGPPHYEAKAWRTTEEEIDRMKHLFPLFRAENYRRMAEGNAPTDAKAHESGLLPVGASLEDAAMVKPAVCPMASTYNFTNEGEEVLLDPSSRTEVLSGSTDPNLVSVKPGDPSFRLCGTVPDILGGWMSMPLISMLFEALHGIVKCTGHDVAKWAGALGREHSAYPPVELLIRRVWEENDPTEVTSEVIFARSTLIRRDIPHKVFKRWALRDRTPIGPLLRPMDAAEVPYTGYVLLSMPEYRSALKTRCIRRPGKFAIQVFPMRPDKICRGEIQIGMEGAKVPFLKLPSPNNEGEFTSMSVKHGQAPCCRGDRPEVAGD